MNKFKLLSAAVFAFAVSNQAAFAEVVKYQIEPNHSHVTWSASHFGFSNQTGKFSDLSGEINFDAKKPQNSSVDVVIKIASLTTGLTKFDGHLKSAELLDADKFATAKFVSKKINVTGKNKAKIEGELTLHGVTKPVVLDAKFNKADVSVVTQKETVGFAATATIKRSEFGINYAIPSVSDEVKIVIEVEANK